METHGLSYKLLMNPCLLTCTVFTFGHGFPGGWQWCLPLRTLSLLQDHLSQVTQTKEHSDLETEPTLLCPPLPPQPWEILSLMALVCAVCSADWIILIVWD